MSSSPRPFARALRLITAALVSAGLLAACSNEPPPPPAVEKVDVVGEFGARPQVVFEAPLQFSEASTKTLVEGTGPVLADGDRALVSFLAIDAQTGDAVTDIYGSQPQIVEVSKDEAGPLYRDLNGATEGTRFVRAELGTKEHPDPVVLVYDVLHTRAWGEPVRPPKGAPKVTLADDGEPMITIPDKKPPPELQVITLKRGEGTQVRPDFSVTLRYTAVSWKSGKPVDGTWSDGQGPTTIAFTGLIQGWQDGLVDTNVGSQVMLIVPPGQAFGDETLVYVIDVLAVSAMDGTEGQTE